MSRTIRRLPWLVTVALVAGVGISQAILTIGDWHLRDMGAYWEAAMRVREGQPLYPALADGEASEVYRYAPWFAWLWVPMTHLPRELVGAVWSGVLLVASAIALFPLIRASAWLAIAFFAPILFGISAIGNVQPLLVAALVLGVERRSGPLWIALAASLKVVPILFVATYLGRREWWRAALTMVLSAVLVAPMLRHDLSAYPVSAGTAGGLIGAPVLYGLIVAGGILVSLRLARSRWGWLASATTATLATPRLFVYDLTLLMAAFPADRSSGEVDRPPGDHVGR